MHSDKIKNLIIERLKGLFDTDNPLVHRDIYITASWKKGCNLAEDQLEDLWLKGVAKICEDDVLESLIQIRNFGYFMEDTIVLKNA